MDVSKDLVADCLMRHRPMEDHRPGLCPYSLCLPIEVEGNAGAPISLLNSHARSNTPLFIWLTARDNKARAPSFRPNHLALMPCRDSLSYRRRPLPTPPQLFLKLSTTSPRSADVQNPKSPMANPTAGPAGAHRPFRC